MKNDNSSTLKVFFEQWLPRLIGISIIAYLIYSLLFKQDSFSWLHIFALAIVIALILAPMAGRLKVLNIIDFSSKLNSLKQEQQKTKHELNELRNQISTVVSTRVSPVQIVTMNGFKEISKVLSSIPKTESEVDSTMSIGKDTKYTKEEFLRRAYGYRYKAHTLLLMTLALQIAMREHREFEEADSVEGNTTDEKISNMIKRILDNGLDTVFPIRVIDEKSEETSPVITPEIVEGLKQISSLLDLYQKVENNEVELPSRIDIDNLFDKIGEALITIAASLQVVGTRSILYQYRMTSAIESLKNEIEQAEAEQRPIRFPPPKSD